MLPTAASMKNHASTYYDLKFNVLNTIMLTGTTVPPYYHDNANRSNKTSVEHDKL